MISKQIIKKVNEVVQPYCKRDWCLLKEIMCCRYQDPRYFIQLKCVEHWKYEESEKAGTDIGWEEAHMSWVSSGCAKLFADYYMEDLTAEQIYEKIIEALRK